MQPQQQARCKGISSARCPLAEAHRQPQGALYTVATASQHTHAAMLRVNGHTLVHTQRHELPRGIHQPTRVLCGQLTP